MIESLDLDIELARLSFSLSLSLSLPLSVSLSLSLSVSLSRTFGQGGHLPTTYKKIQQFQNKGHFSIMHVSETQ